MIQVYQKSPKFGPIIRKLYGYDHFKMYRDFVKYNPSLPNFNPELADKLQDEPQEFLINMLQGLNLPNREQLCGLLRFEHNATLVRDSEADMTIHEIYTFNYIDFQLNRPLENYRPGTTEILLQKENGSVQMKILKIT